MAQQIEHILDSTGRQLVSVTADPLMYGATVTLAGEWFTPVQIVQLQGALQRASDYLVAEGVEA